MRLSRFPRAVLLVIVAITLAALWEMRSLEFAADMEAQLKDHPAYAQFLASRAWFGDTETLAAFYPIGALDVPSCLELFRVVRRLQANRHVARVVSLLDDLPRPFASERELSEYLGAGDSLARLRESLAWYRLARGLVIARDDRALGLWITLASVDGDGGRTAPGRDAGELERGGRDRVGRAAVASIESDLRAELGNRGVHCLGYLAIEQRVIDLLRDSYRTFTPMAVLGGLLILWGFLRTVRHTLLAALSVFAPLCWLLALLALHGTRLNSFSTMLMPLMMAVGLSNTLYFFSQCVNTGVDDSDGIEREAFRRVLVPQLLCTTTNSVGFLSLLVTHIPVIRSFGGWGTLGCVLSILVAFVAIPCGLRLTGPVTSGTVGWLDGALAVAGDRVARHRRRCLAGCLLGLGLAAAGISRISVASSASAFLLDSDPLMRGMRLYDATFAPSTWVELCVKFWPFPVTRLENIVRLAGLQRALESDPLVDSTLSAADVLLDCGSRVSGRRLERLHDARELGLYLRYVEDRGMHLRGSGFVSGDGNAARILVRLRSDDAFQVCGFARRFLGSRAVALAGAREPDAIAGEGAPGAALPGPGPAGGHPPYEQVFFTGLAYLSSVTHEEGVRSEVGSLWGSILSAIGVLGLAFLSLRVALITAIPNISPIVICYGLMGWMGGSLNVATGVMGPVLFGLIMDDTVYILYRFRVELESGAPATEAYRRTLSFVGRPVIMNALTLASGLVLSALAPFPLARAFGLYSALTVVVGVFSDLLLLPILLTYFPGTLREAPATSGRDVPVPGGY